MEEVVRVLDTKEKLVHIKEEEVMEVMEVMVATKKVTEVSESGKYIIIASSPPPPLLQIMGWDIS